MWLRTRVRRRLWILGSSRYLSTCLKLFARLSEVLQPFWFLVIPSSFFPFPVCPFLFSSPFRSLSFNSCLYWAVPRYVIFLLAMKAATRSLLTSLLRCFLLRLYLLNLLRDLRCQDRRCLLLFQFPHALPAAREWNSRLHLIVVGEL